MTGAELCSCGSPIKSITHAVDRAITETRTGHTEYPLIKECYNGHETTTWATIHNIERIVDNASSKRNA